MKIVILLAVVIGSVPMAGCGRQPAISRVAVQGTVTLDGKPLDGATIRFVPRDDQGRGAATLLVDGQFQLDQTEGPTAGDHKIVFSPLAPELPQAIEAMQSGHRDPLNVRTIPLHYQTTGRVQAAVSATGSDDLHFELSSR